MKASLRTTIASYYVIATALLVGFVFVALYLVMYQTVVGHMNSDLDAESRHVFNGIVVLSNALAFVDENEWVEEEHSQAEMNPVFIQVVDTSGKVLRKTPNLRSTLLTFRPCLKKHAYLDTTILNSPVRQKQMPILNAQGRPLGYVIVALPRKEAEIILSNLRLALFVAFPLVLMIVFSISRFIAGKIIAPMELVTAAAERIRLDNLKERISLPATKDELYRLTLTINELLNRLEAAVLHERQFTADASHELRTPLTALKGTLEVLARKTRTQEHYVRKINYCSSEVDRMTHLVDQLLLLARHDTGMIQPSCTIIDLTERIGAAIGRMTPVAAARHVTVLAHVDGVAQVYADPTMMDIILENILSNAIKYSRPHGSVEVGIAHQDRSFRLAIVDHGVGIGEEHLPRIFERFYRADESRNSEISGSGLGLAIVKRLIELQHLSIHVESKPGKGTTVTLTFGTPGDPRVSVESAERGTPPANAPDTPS
jgi:heavy metal sensor kinase